MKVTPNTDWFEDAACKGLTALFFGSHVCGEKCPPLTKRSTSCPILDGRANGNPARIKSAKFICLNLCPVLEECKDWITRFPNESKHGVVAGWSESERKRRTWGTIRIKERGNNG